MEPEKPGRLECGYGDVRHASDDTEQADTERDGDKRPSHSAHRHIVLLAQNIVQQLCLLLRCAVSLTHRLLDTSHDLRRAGILLHALHVHAELGGLDLRVEHDGAHEHGGRHDGARPAQPRPGVDVLEAPLHGRGEAPSVVEAEGLEVADTLGAAEDLAGVVVDNVGDGGEVGGTGGRGVCEWLRRRGVG